MLTAIMIASMFGEINVIEPKYKKGQEVIVAPVKDKHEDNYYKEVAVHEDEIKALYGRTWKIPWLRKS